MGSVRNPSSDARGENAPLLVWRMGKIHLGVTVNGQARAIAVEFEHHSIGSDS